MIVLRLGPGSRKSPIVIGQVFLLQKRIRLSIRPDFVPAQLFYQAALVRAVIIVRLSLLIVQATP
jgi:hypothetical protein